MQHICLFYISFRILVNQHVDTLNIYFMYWERKGTYFFWKIFMTKYCNYNTCSGKWICVLLCNDICLALSIVVFLQIDLYLNGKQERLLKELHFPTPIGIGRPVRCTSDQRLLEQTRLKSCGFTEKLHWYFNNCRVFAFSANCSFNKMADTVQEFQRILPDMFQIDVVCYFKSIT